MNMLKCLKAFCALVMVATLAACTMDPQVGVRRTGTGNANNVDRVASRPAVANHVVQKGETLYAIAFKYSVDFRDIARWNRISDPYTIYPNQRLFVRDPTAAPVVAASAVRSNPARTTSNARGGVRGAGARGSRGAGTRGSVVVTRIPEQSVTRPSISSQSINAGTPVGAGSGVSVAAIATPVPLASSQLTDSAAAPNRAPAFIPEAEIVAPPGAFDTPSVPGVKPTAGRNGWGWPVHGKLITTFASADPGRQGIDIAGNFGDAVYSANAGEVVYSGRGIIGYGELIVIKHDNTTLTAYGHNRRRLVKEGQRIKQGETIAEMGRDTRGRALLHFELRRNGKPVDPLGVLPAR